MAAEHSIAQLGGWDGYEVEGSWEKRRGETRWCVIRLRALVGIARRCSRCGGSTTAVHDSEGRRVRDLPIFEVPVELIVPRLRLQCETCGPKLEALDWLAPYARVTTTSVARLCKVMSVRHVAAFYGLVSGVNYYFWRIDSAFCIRSANPP